MSLSNSTMLKKSRKKNKSLLSNSTRLKKYRKKNKSISLSISKILTTSPKIALKFDIPPPPPDVLALEFDSTSPPQPDVTKYHISNTEEFRFIFEDIFNGNQNLTDLAIVMLDSFNLHDLSHHPEITHTFKTSLGKEKKTSGNKTVGNVTRRIFYNKNRNIRTKTFTFYVTDIQYAVKKFLTEILLQMYAEYNSSQRCISSNSFRVPKILDYGIMKGDINNINNTAESSNDFYTLYFEMENMKKLITLTDYQRNLSFDDPHKLIQCDTLAEFIREKLSCLNSIGITHQDINTNNIMISRDGKQIAIIDFGEAILNDPAATDPADKKYTCDNIIGEITDNTSSRWGGIKNRKTKKLKNEN
jgi:hypothetical protein